MSVDSYVVANSRRCTVHPQHVMVNQGRSDAHAADLFECACGETAIGNTDEALARAVSAQTGAGVTPGAAAPRAEGSAAVVPAPPARSDLDFTHIGVCRGCGCTDLEACWPEGCIWVAPNLCSNCGDPKP